MFTTLITLSQEKANYEALKKEYYQSKVDTQKIKILDKLIENSPEEIWPKYNDTLISICLKKVNSHQEKNKIDFYKNYLSTGYNNKAIDLTANNKAQDAIKYYELSLDNISAGKNPTLTLYVLQNLGGTYQQIGQNNKAAQVYTKVLEKSIKTNNKEGVVSAYKFLGNLAYRTKDITKAKKYYYEGIKICKENNLEEDLSIIYNDLGLVYKSQKDIDSSTKLFNASYLLRIKNKNYSKAAKVITNAALNHIQKNDFAEAKRSLDLAEATLKNTNSISAIAYLKQAYASFYLQQGQIKKAIIFGEEAWSINSISDEISLKLSTSNVLYSIYLSNKNYEKALNFYIINRNLNDSLNVLQMKNSSNELEVKFEYEKKVLADSLKRNEEKAISNFKILQQKKQKYILIIVVVIVSILGLVIYRRFKTSVKQNKIIEKQKHEVNLKNTVIEQKQKEILDSIKYAKRIQQAMLPSYKFIERNLNQKNK